MSTAKNNLSVLKNAVREKYPTATKIQFLKSLRKTVFRENAVQFSIDGQNGIATLGALKKDEIALQFPYRGMLWIYNT